MNLKRRVIQIGLIVLLTSLLFMTGAVSAKAQIPPGYSLVAENQYLELYIEQDLVHFVIHHKESGETWHTNPDIGLFDNPGSLWAQHSQSQLVLEYTDLRRRSRSVTNNIRQDAMISLMTIEDGIRATFTMQGLGFQIPVDYVLGDNYLEVNIPHDEIKETGDHLLTWIQVVPFFDAAHNSEEGYMVIPDGSGAVTHFTDEHPRYNSGFEGYVYGRDGYTFHEHGDDLFFMTTRQEVGMPVFGMVNNGKAFLGVITQGEYDSQIIASPSGYIIDFYRAGVQFTYRKGYRVSLSRATTVSTWESRPIETDRTVRFYLLTGDDADYIGMANVYRDYIQQHFNIAGRLHMKDDVPPIHIRIFNAIIKPGLVLDELVVMTTFKESQEIVQALLDIGVDHMDVSLIGWNKDGLDGILPRRLPAESALGGDRGLKEFTSWANEQGIDIFLEANYLDAFQGNGGFNNRHDVIRGPSRIPVNYRDHYLLSPVVAFERFARSDIPQMASRYGVNGLELTRFGRHLLVDRNYNYTLEREDTAFWWLQIARLSQEELGRVAIRGSSTWLLSVADKVLDIPTEPSTLLFVDYSIPFYQIVVSGLVPYTTYPSNLRNDPRREFLKMLEYGAVPSFEITYRDASLLRDTMHSVLFSSLYTHWIEEILYEFEVANKKMGYLKAMAITEHQQLAPDVFITGYEDGSRVYVNYRDTDYVTDTGVEIGALDYVLIKGGENE